MQFLSAVSIILVFSFIEASNACNGYHINVTEITTCEPHSLIWFDQNFQVELTKDCLIVPRGCIHYGSYNTANANVSVRKNGVLISEVTQDLCDAPSNVPKSISKLGLPLRCPVNQNQVCYNGQAQINIRGFKRLLSKVQGRYEVNIEIAHDTGNSCIRLRYEVAKF